MKMNGAEIKGSGIYIPANVMPNEQLEEILELEPGYIEKTVGIKRRSWPNAEETVEFMAAEATLSAVRDAGVARLDALIIARDVIATRRARSTGLRVMQRLSSQGINVENCFSMDLSNYCPGFVYGLNIAQLMVKAGQADNVGVVASTRYADIVELNRNFNAQFVDTFDPENEQVSQYSLSTGGFQPPKSNAFLWGNGAGAVIVGRSNIDRFGNFKTRTSKRTKYDSWGIGESVHGQSFGYLDGGAIYRFAIEEVPEFISDLLDESGIAPEEIDVFIPHQPNPRILRRLAEEIRIPRDRLLITCDTLGNMLAASAPVTYHLARENGKIKRGDRIMFCVFGDSYLTASGLIYTEK